MKIHHKVLVFYYAINDLLHVWSDMKFDKYFLNVKLKEKHFYAVSVT